MHNHWELFLNKETYHAAAISRKWLYLPILNVRQGTNRISSILQETHEYNTYNNHWAKTFDPKDHRWKSRQMPHFAPAPANLGLSANRCRAITFRACRVQLHGSSARWRKWCASAGALNATWWRRTQLAANTSNQFWARIPATSYIGPKISRNPSLAGPCLSGRRFFCFKKRFLSKTWNLLTLLE